MTDTQPTGSSDVSHGITFGSAVCTMTDNMRGRWQTKPMTDSGFASDVVKQDDVEGAVGMVTTWSPPCGLVGADDRWRFINIKASIAAEVKGGTAESVRALGPFRIKLAEGDTLESLVSKIAKTTGDDPVLDLVLEEGKELSAKSIEMTGCRLQFKSTDPGSTPKQWEDCQAPLSFDGQGTFTMRVKFQKRRAVPVIRAPPSPSWYV